MIKSLIGENWDTTPRINLSSAFTFNVGQVVVHGILGDITETQVDAFVNSSNKFLDLTKGLHVVLNLLTLLSYKDVHSLYPVNNAP